MAFQSLEKWKVPSKTNTFKLQKDPAVQLLEREVKTEELPNTIPFPLYFSKLASLSPFALSPTHTHPPKL